MKFQTERQMCAGTLLKEGDYTSVRQVFERLLQYKPDAPILAELDKNKEIKYYTSTDIYEEMMNLGDGLVDAGLSGKHIAIIADNSCRYVIADTTISSGVGVVVPMDVDASVELTELLLKKADVDAVLCSSRCLEKLLKVRINCPRLKMLITIDKKMGGFLCYDELVEKGKSMKEKSVFRNMELDTSAPAKILFTSGTTGANKGVVLTNDNLAANIINCMDTIMADEGNTAMSVLPMHHATEINTHVMTRAASGRLTYINDSIRNMMPNFKVFKPNFTTVVPMIANAFYKNIWANAEKAGKADKLRKGIKISNMLRKFGVDKTHSMFAEIHAPFGGNLTTIVCGGSMLNPVVVRGLNDLGIRVENGYGITECGPLISMNADTLLDWLSVGKPCPGIEAKIVNPDEEGVGELCVRGKSVAKGYYNDPEATAAAFGADGFFNTGDSARIDEKGRIFLMGRKKNTIVLQNGKNICPEEVENVIETNLPYANDIVVYPAEFNGQQVLCAGLYIEDVIARSDRARIEADIKKVNALLPSYKTIDYVEIPSEAYPKTSTHKIVRKNLPDKCSERGIKIF